MFNRIILLLLFIYNLNAQVALPTFHGVHKPQDETSSLYSFSSQTFTNCGETGKNGPTLSDCTSDANYSDSWTDNTDYFNVQTQGIQEWTVPQTGTYRIEAYGAQGGPGNFSLVGGKGARMRGDFSLAQGDVIKIVVGQMGETTSDGDGAGGGGGTFITKSPYNSNSSILVIAGGGGGTGKAHWNHGFNGLSGLTGTSGGDSYPENGGGSGGTSGNGGTNPGGRNIGGSGGGGFFSDGYDAPNRNSDGGTAFTSNPTGGDGSSNGDGGYGGGGGGYSGGGGGGWSNGCGGSGGGGGSYNSGSNTSNSEGARESHGQLIITLQ